MHDALKRQQEQIRANNQRDYSQQPSYTSVKHGGAQPRTIMTQHGKRARLSTQRIVNQGHMSIKGGCGDLASSSGNALSIGTHQSKAARMRYTVPC